ncbi:Velvet factor [Penicillium verhagenii]|uniref:Velvet factor n=1 Tax=Penicillium verhagenii TaxID=1562060 RepID=UPI0025450AE8|nr:Velvet factor [Penicillium verhagenii]KAJ5915587.1 Velvet factor [Penicillium verhagenii]
MSASKFSDAAFSREAQRSDFDLIIRQQPDRARVAGGKEKERKPIDPPPIVQLRVRDERSYLAQHYLQSPFYFMCCSLYSAQENHPVPVVLPTPLAGTLVSSLHPLKDVNNSDGGFFVFGDLSVKMAGEFRLMFTLFEMRRYSITYLKTTMSDCFTVSPVKSFPGMMESTFLSRSFADQGVKLRIRKGPRTMMKRPLPDSFPQVPSPRSLDSQYVRIPPAVAIFGDYPAASQEYAYYGPPVSRTQTSIDYDRQSLYPDLEGRMARPMETHTQQPAIYGQLNTYQNPVMQYSTGQVVPDYGVPYSLLPSNEISQLPDLGDQARSSQ